MGFFDYFNNDLAIDLGTANTLITSKGSVVVDEPSIIAIDRMTNKVLAIGSRSSTKFVMENYTIIRH